MDILELKDVCRRVRRNIITMTNKAGAGHPGGSLSATEAMGALVSAATSVPKSSISSASCTAFSRAIPM